MDQEHPTQNGSPESRRRSGRVVRKPDLFSQEHNIPPTPPQPSAKRKRVTDVAPPIDDDEQDDDEETSEDDESEGEADEEELKAKRKAQKARWKATKPASKRAKITNGPPTALAIRSTKAQGKARAKLPNERKTHGRPGQVHQPGLFGEVFGGEVGVDDTAAAWVQSAQRDSVPALRDLVNFVLTCIGCDSRIEAQDIEDFDSVPSKLGDVLQEYEQQQVPDYPLISKLKQYAGFQSVLEEFAQAIIKALHSSSVFYDQPEVYDNIHVWIATMSGASYKSFRHTATIISLAMSTALCEVAQELQQNQATLKSQLDAEKMKKSVNKARVKSIEGALKTTETKLASVDGQLKDAFDTVYVHRYRDVEDKIRVPCVTALGNWIIHYRKMFLESQYLRYLGWVLNDTNSATRLEDVKQLQKLFENKKNIAALRAFSERFRSRLVEMGTRDADISVRAEAIELLDELRDSELLEPTDIDTIGRLIFDSEPRVRKSVAQFFVANIEDLYGASIDDFDQAQFDAALPDSSETEDSMTPTKSWLKFKCLASVLAGYDNDDDLVNATGSHAVPVHVATDSRYILATESIFPHMVELQQWESLAAYLLYDHSSIRAQRSKNDMNVQIQQAYKLHGNEDLILLDVLFASVKLHLASIAEPVSQRRTNAAKDQLRSRQESAAQSLLLLLPQLLNKFGSSPQGASTTLRLCTLLDLGLINEFQSSEDSPSAILDAIVNQFTSHSNQRVLATAGMALRHARNYEQMREATDLKVQEVWLDAITTLTDLFRGKDVEKRDTFDYPSLVEVVNVATRLTELAGVCDCTEVVDSKLGTAQSKKHKGKVPNPTTLLNMLLQLLRRGEPQEDTTAGFAELEDRLLTALVELFSRYFRWKLFRLKQAIAANHISQLTAHALTNLAMTRTTFVENVMPSIELRMPLDPVRYNTIINVLELFALFTTVKNMRPEKGELVEAVRQNLNSLVTPVPEDIVAEVMKTYEKMEKSFAKKTHRKIETMAKSKPDKNAVVEATQEEIEKPPEDSDDEDGHSVSGIDSDSDGEDFPAGGRSAKKQGTLLVEQHLCELTSKIIFALVGGAFRDDKVKSRLLLNRTKLGKNYSALVAYLDVEKDKKKASSRAKQRKAPKSGTKATSTAQKPVVSEELVLSEDDVEDDADDDEVQRQRELEDDVEDAVDVEHESEDPADVDDEIMGD